MSSKLIDAALLCENGYTSPNVDLVGGKINGAISHKTPRKRKDPPAEKLTPPKRRCTAAKSLLALAPEDMSSRMLQCIFVAGKCIPLWPQYVHSSDDQRVFIRVDGNELWLRQHLHILSRRAQLHTVRRQKGGNPNPYARIRINDLCEDVLQHFRIAIVEFRRKQAALKKCAIDAEPGPGLFAIKMHDCDLIAAVHDCHFYLLINEQAVTWINTGLTRMLTAYIDVQLRAIVIWMPLDRKWILKYDGPSGAHEQYCEEKNITFAVQADLEDDDYRIARQKAFLNACLAWNEIDESLRTRITLPEHQLNVHIVPILESTALSHAESGRGSDEEYRPCEDE